MKHYVFYFLQLIAFCTLASGWLVSKPLVKKKLLKRCRPRVPTVKSSGTIALAGSAGALSALWKQASKDQLENFTPEQGTLVGKTILITGASSGLGLESAKRLAVGGADLILTVRSDSKGVAAVDSVIEYLKDKDIVYEDQKISYKLLDLDNLEQIKQSVGNWTDVTKIDVLLNNAGIMALPNREVTTDGFERQMQSNHLGPFLLTTLLKDKLSSDARIINVSSSAHKFASQGLLFDYMWNASTGYTAWKSYGQSKLANIYFTRELQKRIDDADLNWKTVSLHPGVVSTNLGRYLMDDSPIKSNDFFSSLSKAASSIFLKTPEQGATTQVWLTCSDEIEAGKFYADCKPRVLDDFATNRASAARLWRESEERTGVDFRLDKF